MSGNPSLADPAPTETIIGVFRRLSIVVAIFRHSAVVFRRLVLSLRLRLPHAKVLVLHNPPTLLGNYASGINHVM